MKLKKPEAISDNNERERIAGAQEKAEARTTLHRRGEDEEKEEKGC